MISGFSGAGKGTIVRHLMEKYDNYALSISMTTRPPRKQEQDGVDYFFVTKERFERAIEEEGLIEYAAYCGNYYGTPRAYVEEQLSQGKDVILEIEIQGALKIKKKFPECLLLFVMPPNVEELRKRLVGRGTETLEVIEERLKRASEESEGIEAYDYIIRNEEIEESVEQAHRLVEAARSAPARQEAFIRKIREELKTIAKGAE